MIPLFIAVYIYCVLKAFLMQCKIYQYTIYIMQSIIFISITSDTL